MICSGIVRLLLFERSGCDERSIGLIAPKKAEDQEHVGPKALGVGLRGGFEVSQRALRVAKCEPNLCQPGARVDVRLVRYGRLLEVVVRALEVVLREIDFAGERQRNCVSAPLAQQRSQCIKRALRLAGAQERRDEEPSREDMSRRSVEHLSKMHLGLRVRSQLVLDRSCEHEARDVIGRGFEDPLGRFPSQRRISLPEREQRLQIEDAGILAEDPLRFSDLACGRFVLVTIDQQRDQHAPAGDAVRFKLDHPLKSRDRGIRLALGE